MTYNFTLKEARSLTDEYFTLFTDIENKEFLYEINNYIAQRKVYIKDFFEINQVDNYQINLFSTHTDFLAFTNQFFKPSDYCKAHFANNMINVSTSVYNFDSEKVATTILHEYVHLLYKNHFETERTVWFDEGLAMYLSGQLSHIDLQTFIETKITAPNKIIPSIDYLKSHGSKYGQFVDLETNQYNGYNLSYLAVRYLVETKDKKELFSIMKSKDQLEIIGQTVLNDALEHYNLIKNNSKTM